MKAKITKHKEVGIFVFPAFLYSIDMDTVVYEIFLWSWVLTIESNF